MDDPYPDHTQPGVFDLGHVVERSRGLISGSKRYGEAVGIRGEYVT